MTDKPTDPPSYFDFNDAEDQKPPETREQITKDELKQKFLNNLENNLFSLFPAGCVEKNTFKIGNVHGDQGQSLVVELIGPKIGLWHDHATGEGGDIFDLYAATKNLDTKHHFSEIMRELRSWLGEKKESPEKHQSSQSDRGKKKAPQDNLGPHTGKWDYHDEKGKLIACVYRYDPPGRRKIFRPYNVKTGKYEAPDPRPLYNIPSILKSDVVILCEGEKCAEALVKQGYCATTAMNGANAPVDKTDWSPLDGKDVYIWPDNDQAGKDYAQRAAQALKNTSVKSVRMLVPPEKKPDKWDAADAADEKFDIKNFLTTATDADHRFEKPALDAYSLQELLDDPTPMPDDIIAPRILTPGGIAVLAGAPKVGKSDFVLTMLVHMAAGKPFLNFKPPRPLKVFYLQAEIEYAYLKERIRQIIVDFDLVGLAAENIFITPRTKFILDEDGVEKAASTILKKFPTGPDIICIDPIRNVFDGGPDSRGENDNNSMLFFLQERVEKLRSMVNPSAGVILIHHTKKLTKAQFKDDPFLAVSGAGSLRSYYSTGILLFREDELNSERMLIFELRNGPAIDNKLVDKKDGVWVEMDISVQRLANAKHGGKLDAERDRKNDRVLFLIAKSAKEGNLYTADAFCRDYENKEGLGGFYSIKDRVKVLTQKGFIKYVEKIPDLGIGKSKSTNGYLVTQHMKMRHGDEWVEILPTHYRAADSHIKPVENPREWPELEGYEE